MTLVSSILPLCMLTSCGGGPARVQLAVDKLSAQQIAATPYLPLNEDMPGTPVEVERYLAPGKYTIVVFYSPYSDTCVNITSRLAKLPQVNPNIAVRTVNINRPGVQAIDWQSPIIQADGIASLPYIRIYEPSQTLRAHGRPAYEQVMQWIQYIPN